MFTQKINNNMMTIKWIWLKQESHKIACAINSWAVFKKEQKSNFTRLCYELKRIKRFEFKVTYKNTQTYSFKHLQIWMKTKYLAYFTWVQSYIVVSDIGYIQTILNIKYWNDVRTYKILLHSVLESNVCKTCLLSNFFLIMEILFRAKDFF